MLCKKEVAWCKPDPNQPRQAFDPQELASLGASLAKKQLVPLLARSDGTIIDGERRWRAAKLAGLATIDVVVTDEPLTAAQVTEMQMVTALHRAGLTPYEQYLGCAEWMKQNPGATAKELADRLDRDPSMIGKLMTLGNCIPAVVEAAREGKIGPAHWSSISLIPTEQQGELLALALSGASAKDVSAASRRKRNGTISVVRVGRIRCPLPSGATVQVTAEAISLDDAIEAVQEWLKEAKRASEQGLDAKTFERVMADKAKVR